MAGVLSTAGPEDHWGLRFCLISSWSGQLGSVISPHFQLIQTAGICESEFNINTTEKYQAAYIYILLHIRSDHIPQLYSGVCPMSNMYRIRLRNAAHFVKCVRCVLV
jgi:hypothetical protein